VEEITRFSTIPSLYLPNTRDNDDDFGKEEKEGVVGVVGRKEGLEGGRIAAGGMRRERRED
jgi:hypothetical protein